MWYLDLQLKCLCALTFARIHLRGGLIWMTWLWKLAHTAEQSPGRKEDLWNHGWIPYRQPSSWIQILPNLYPQAASQFTIQNAFFTSPWGAGPCPLIMEEQSYYMLCEDFIPDHTSPLRFVLGLLTGPPWLGVCFLVLALWGSWPPGTIQILHSQDQILALQSLRIPCARPSHSFPEQTTPLLTFETIIRVLVSSELGSVQCHCPHRTNCFHFSVPNTN